MLLRSEQRLASPLHASTRVTHLLFSLATKARTRHDEGVRTRWGARMDAVTTIRRTTTHTPPRRRRLTLSRRRPHRRLMPKTSCCYPDRPQLRPRSPRATTTAGCPPAPAARDMPEARPVARRTHALPARTHARRPALHAHETLPCGMPARGRL